MLPVTISPVFIRPKPVGTFRVILTSNLQCFNEFVQYSHFKINTLESAIQLTKQGCFMASIDLKDAYYSVPVAKKGLEIFQIHF